MRLFTTEHAEDLFAAAWEDPAATSLEMPPLDVNALLEQHYQIDRPLTFTRSTLWDNEVRKAWEPDAYIPWVVREHSAEAWGATGPTDEVDVFVRMSQQRLWLEPESYGLILERVHLNREQQRITFLGAAELEDIGGKLLHADPRQALFHVEHSVGGDEARPLNQWRVVHLTDHHDQHLADVFNHLIAPGTVPDFIEIYIRRVLGIGLSRREAVGTRRDEASA